MNPAHGLRSLVRQWVVPVESPPNSSFVRRRESRGEVRVVAMTLELSHQPMHPFFKPWCAGTSRHERLL